MMNPIEYRLLAGNEIALLYRKLLFAGIKERIEINKRIAELKKSM